MANRAHSHTGPYHQCREVRRYAVVALTNLTFGNASIKSYLCSFPGFVEIMVGQLDSNWETWEKQLHTYSEILLRKLIILLSLFSLSHEWCRCWWWRPCWCQPGPWWRHPQGQLWNQDVMKVILSALWNLSAHYRKNKSDVCSIKDKALETIRCLDKSDTLENIIRKKDLKIEFCDDKFTNFIDLKMHLKTHSFKKASYACKYCDLLLNNL